MNKKDYFLLERKRELKNVEHEVIFKALLKKIKKQLIKLGSKKSALNLPE